MPTYEYLCQNCGYQFEQFQSITARPLRACPKCGRKRLKRLIGAGTGILFKGSGFYQTDYRTESYKAGEKREKSASDSETKKEKTDTQSKTKDAKPAKKNKSKTKSEKESA